MQVFALLYTDAETVDQLIGIYATKEIAETWRVDYQYENALGSYEVRPYQVVNDHIEEG